MDAMRTVMATKNDNNCKIISTTMHNLPGTFLFSLVLKAEEEDTSCWLRPRSEKNKHIKS